MRSELRPWTDPPCPEDGRHTRGCWSMARIAADQHPLGVRTLWAGEQLQAIGGVVELAGDGLAFYWKRPGLSRFAWRRVVVPLILGLSGAHERGLRRIFAIVAAAHAEGIRLVKQLGFEFVNDETGWPNTSEPMLRYMHASPVIEEPLLVRHQRRELERACHAVWCPELVT